MNKIIWLPVASDILTKFLGLYLNIIAKMLYAISPQFAIFYSVAPFVAGTATSVLLYHQLFQKEA